MEYEELSTFFMTGTTLYLTTPILKKKHNHPHDQVMAIGLLHKTVHGFPLIQQLWSITKKRLIITYLENIQCGIATTLSNERIYVYTSEYIEDMIMSLHGAKKYLTMDMKNTRYGYTETIMLIDRDDIDDT